MSRKNNELREALSADFVADAQPTGVVSQVPSSEPSPSSTTMTPTEDDTPLVAGLQSLAELRQADMLTAEEFATAKAL
eukprot:COSAG01_NODE_29346_length_640_cov_0.665434_1_plen_77_part_01